MHATLVEDGDDSGGSSGSDDGIVHGPEVNDEEGDPASHGLDIQRQEKQADL